MSQPVTFSKPMSSMLTLAAVAVVVTALYLAKGVLLPLTLSVLLSFLLAPVCDRLERLRLPRVAAVAATMLIACTVVTVVGATVAMQLGDLATKLPQYRENIGLKLYSVNGRLSEALNKLNRTTAEIGRMSEAGKDAPDSPAQRERSYPVRVVSQAVSPFRILSGMFGTLLEMIGTAGVVVVFVIFFLVRREDLRDRFIRLVGHGQMMVTTQALGDAARRVSRYLAMQLAVNVAFGVPVAVGLWLIGIPNAVLWGMLATALRFIPYIGAWISASMPIALGFAISPGWWVPLLTVAMFVVLELLISNVVEPWLYGSRTGVSAVAVIVSAMFWAWLWGGIGLVLATPLTVCLAVIGKYVPGLAFLDVLLGDEPVFDPPTRVYQRLLAGDQEEAMELVEQDLKTKSLADVYDTVLTPALVLAERDRHRGDLDEHRERFVYAAIREIMEEAGEQPIDAEDRPELGATHDQNDDDTSSDLKLDRAAQSGRRETNDKSSGGEFDGDDSGSEMLYREGRVLCLPARDDADEIAAGMLAQVLQRKGWNAEAVPVTALVSEMVERVAEREAEVVCISAVPPAAVTHARYLYKRLRARFPDARVVVGLWSGRGDLANAKERIGNADNLRVVRSLSDACEQVQLLMHAALLQSEPTAAKSAAAMVSQA
jgi:predicted PurR-regulated permease PerM/methylmalonyl-CoA mutase cobalamin-binding subunit